ncbi:hypothetical protein ADIAG_03252 [Paeniglutamicibacter gangotriensis Lz1y]|uniref:Uncharacterized protein n=2 Tax=Paeniglutamicibacter gangotriensis TaxID=254787 RepID=M7MM96_9MICC|nr:hypothetical protein ADIAG_03252 [Paeniglutamicibacter gangotriensis Lz1y]
MRLETGYYLNMVEMNVLPMPPRTEADVVGSGFSMLRDRLPLDWILTELAVEGGPPRADAVFMLRSPDGGELQILVAAKRLLDGRDIGRMRERFDKIIDSRPGSIGMVAARYLTKSTRERLSEAGLSFVDATGNLLMRAQSPAVFISDRGADKDPWRGAGRPRGTLKGEPAAKVVRALLDMQGPWKIRDLVTASASSTGSVYRVVEFLESEALINRGADKLITVPDWPALLRRWSEDYQFLRTNSVSRWIAPRGIEAFLERVRKDEIHDYAITGSIAAAIWAPYAPVRSAMIYSQNPERAAEAWGLRATDTGANVILARPAYEVLAERVINRPDGLRIAAPAQVAADLMTGPGRAPAEAEELVDWMTDNEQLWR